MPGDHDIDDLLAKAQRPVLQAPRLHALYKGKIQIMPKCAIRGLDDFAIWYTPGVAEPCREIVKDPDLVFEYTNRGNSIAIVTDGCRAQKLHPGRLFNRMRLNTRAAATVSGIRRIARSRRFENIEVRFRPSLEPPTRSSPDQVIAP